MRAPKESQIARAVSDAGPCHLCGATALYCDPDVREDDIVDVSHPVPAPGYELEGVLRCAVCSTANGFVSWGPRQ